MAAVYWTCTRENNGCKKAVNMICLLVVMLAMAGQVQCETTSKPVQTDDAETTRNVTTDTVTGPLSPSVCNMSIFMSDVESNESSNPVEDFRRLVVDDGAIFVYMKLDFVDVEFEDPLSAYLEDIGNIIDPLTWVWAKGGRGKLLLASPFDFNQLSLTTLSTGVFSLTVKIQSSGCIDSGEADGEKIQSITRLLQDLVKGANEDGNDQTDEIEELICLEKQLGKDDFSLSGAYFPGMPGSSYTMMQASTAFDCRSNGADNKVMRVHTESWLTWILAGGIILALFSPMAMSFFIQKNPPEKEKNPPEKDKNGIERLSLVSDLPLGLKYVTCFWANNNIFVASTRWTVFILLFTLTQYIPVLVSFLTDMDGFMKRIYALYNTGPLNPVVSVVSHLLVDVVFVLAAIVLLERFFRDAGQQFLEPLLRERARTSSSISEGEFEGTTSGEEVEMTSSGSQEGATEVRVEDDNIAYRHIVLVEAPEELWAPSTSLVSSQAFFYYMGWRARMGVDIKAWRFVLYGWLWGWISEHIGAPPDNPRTVVCVIIFIILYPVYLPLSLIFFSFNSLPLMYCITRCFQTSLSNNVKCSELFFSFLIAIASIAWFFKFVATFIYISELLGYSFMGFVVNADVVGPTVLVVVIIAGYIVGAITGFYDGYCVLFSQVMKVAESVDEEKKKAEKAEQLLPGRGGAETRRRIVREPRASSAARRDGEIEMTSRGDEQHDNGSAAPAEECVVYPLVKFNAKAIPTLELKLFWLIVEKYRPIRVQVASTFFQLLVIIISIGFGMSILAIADSLSNLSTTVELFASVIIAGVVPTVLLALKSPASQDCYDQAKERQIEADLSHFAQNGKLRSTAP